MPTPRPQLGHKLVVDAEFASPPFAVVQHEHPKPRVDLANRLGEADLAAWSVGLAVAAAERQALVVASHDADQLPIALWSTLRRSVDSYVDYGDRRIRISALRHAIKARLPHLDEDVAVGSIAVAFVLGGNDYLHAWATVPPQRWVEAALAPGAPALVQREAGSDRLRVHRDGIVQVVAEIYRQKFSASLPAENPSRPLSYDDLRTVVARALLARQSVAAPDVGTLPSARQLQLWLDRIEAVVSYQQTVYLGLAHTSDTDWVVADRPSGFALRDRTLPPSADNVVVVLDVKADGTMLGWPPADATSAAAPKRPRRTATPDDLVVLQALLQKEPCSKNDVQTAARTLGWEEARVRQWLRAQRRKIARRDPPQST